MAQDPSPSMQMRHDERQEPGNSDLPLVSVAIACYNQAHFLPTAIESVRAQSYTNFEIIIVDDGSVDDTAQIAAAYPGVRCIQQANQGLSAARNTGLLYSRGEFVVFLDADDRLLPRALEVGLLCMQAYPESAFVSGHFRYINVDGSPLSEFPQNQVQDHHYLALLRGNYIGMHAAVMYRRSIFEEVGHFDTSLRACEDYDIYLRIARTFPVYCHNEVITEYRQHGANMSGDPTFMLQHALGVLRRQQPYVRKDPARKRAYRYGLLAWQAHYGERLFERAAQRRAGGNTQQANQLLVAALRRTPLYAGYHIAKWIYGHGYGLLYRLSSPAMREQIAHRLYQISAPPVGRVRFGDLGRVTPVAQANRLSPDLRIDQHYIETFIASQALYLRGNVLEIGQSGLLAKHQGPRITDVTHLALGDGQDAETLLDDLSCADHLGADSFDCILLSDVLHRLYDLAATMRTLYLLLKPGGVLLATMPGIGLVKPSASEEAGYWTFTRYSAQKLLEQVFDNEMICVEAKGNVLAATAFLQGLSVEGLTPEELAYSDPQFQLVVTARAIKYPVGASVFEKRGEQGS